MILQVGTPEITRSRDVRLVLKGNCKRRLGRRTVVQMLRLPTDKIVARTGLAKIFVPTFLYL